MKDDEHIIRIARIPDGRPWEVVNLADGLHGSRPVIVAISLCRVARQRDPTYVLYFLDSASRCLALLQCETMRAALDVAHRYAGTAEDDWTTCRIVVPENGELNVQTLDSHVADR